MRNNIILVFAAVVAVGLGAIFVGSSDNKVQAQTSYSRALAECVLDNLKNANSDAGAAFMLIACRSLNP